MLEIVISICLILSNVAGLFFTYNCQEDVENISKKIEEASIRNEKSEKYNRKMLRSFFAKERKDELTVFFNPVHSVGFDDIYGAFEAKSTLKRSLKMFKNPKNYQLLHCEPPSAMILYGSPGTGKTSLAEATYNHLIKIFNKNKSKFSDKKPIYVQVDGSKIGGELVVDAARQIRILFDHCRKFVSEGYFVILVFDELDTFCRKRGGISGKTADSGVNEMISQLNYSEENILIIATTNDIDSIDPALRRPGRFGVEINVTPLDWNERFRMLNEKFIKSGNLLSRSFLETVTGLTSGFSGAQIKAIIELSKILAVESTPKGDEKSVITQQHVFEAFQEVISGKVIPKTTSELDLQRTSFHEAAHAVTFRSLSCPGFLGRITIVPRGRALGACYFGKTAEQENENWDQKALIHRIAVCLAGGIAEKIKFDSYNTGISSDVSEARRIAKAMSGLGMTADGKEIVLFYTKKENAKELEDITHKSLKLAQDIVQKNMEVIETISDYLIKNKEMSRETFEEIMERYEAKSKFGETNLEIHDQKIKNLSLK